MEEFGGILQQVEVEVVGSLTRSSWVRVRLLGCCLSGSLEVGFHVSCFRWVGFAVVLWWLGV